ncbi:MAG: hypothetical protein Q4A82_03440 [Corynebacterium sp.]|nr:hypothetical protein [Corynebacterium sp.]
MTITGIFTSFSVLSLGIEKLLGPEPDAATFANLEILIGIELLSIVASLAACPILAWLYLLECRTSDHWGLFWGTIALGLLAEPFYDRVVTGHWFDFRATNLMWALVVCFLVEKLVAFRSRGVQLIVVLAGVGWLTVFPAGQWLPPFAAGLIVYLFFLLFHYLYDRENLMMLTAGMIGAVCFVTPAIGVLLLHYRAEPGDWPRPAWLLLYPAAFMCLTVAALIR